MKAIVLSTDCPGLFDIQVEDGRILSDLTIGQLYDVVSRYGFDLNNTQLAQPQKSD